MLWTILHDSNSFFFRWCQCYYQLINLIVCLFCLSLFFSNEIIIRIKHLLKLNYFNKYFLFVRKIIYYSFFLSKAHAAAMQQQVRKPPRQPPIVNPAMPIQPPLPPSKKKPPSSINHQSLSSFFSLDHRIYVGSVAWTCSGTIFRLNFVFKIYFYQIAAEVAAAFSQVSKQFTIQFSDNNNKYWCSLGRCDRWLWCRIQRRAVTRALALSSLKMPLPHLPPARHPSTSQFRFSFFFSVFVKTRFLIWRNDTDIDSFLGSTSESWTIEFANRHLQ